MKCLFLLFLIVILTISCKKFVNLPPPQTEMEAATVFENDESAVAAVHGLYSQMMTATLSLANGGTTIYPGLAADEIVNTAASADYDAFRLNEIPVTASTVYTRFWTTSYRTIYHANAILEGLKTSSISATLRTQLMGEMLFIRAFYNFYLVNLFGDIPLVLTTSYEQNQKLSRQKADDVYKQILSDLEDASSKLNAAYPSAGKLRPNLYTAKALLARVHLYLGNWSDAESVATEILNSNIYSLAGLEKTFTPGNSESIWELSPVSATMNTTEGYYFNTTSSAIRPTFSLTDGLLNAFTADDKRKQAWIKVNTVGGKAYPYPAKYKIKSGAPPYQEHLIMFRLAELYLIRAEARAKRGKLVAALDDLNKIRRRAGLSDLGSTDPLAIVDAIAKERRLELMTEWGHRWFDLKRTGRADAVLSQVKPQTWQPTDKLFPIPDIELEVNPFLTQNPGYQ